MRNLLLVLALTASTAIGADVTEFYLPVPPECLTTTVMESTTLVLNGSLTRTTVETCNGTVIGFLQTTSQ